MPLLLREKILHHAEYAVWKIDEEPAFYLSNLILSDWEKNYLDNISHPKRKLTWLASRYLLKYLMATNEFVELLFDIHGKPFISNFEVYVSLSHTNNHSAAIISKKYEVGIDIEEQDGKIESIKNKFLSSIEITNIGDDDHLKKLLIYWSAKEVMYKIYGKRKLEFKEDMYVKPFMLEERGDIDGVLMKGGMIADYHMHYLIEENFTLVVGIENEVSVITA